MDAYYMLWYGSTQPQGSLTFTGYTHLKNASISVPVPGGTLVSSTSFTYDTFSYNYGNTSGFTGTKGKLLQKAEYGFGMGSAGPPVRQTALSYLDDSSPGYVTAPSALHFDSNGYAIANNISNRVIDQQIKDGSGSLKAETKTTYDSTPLTGVTGIQSHDDTNFGSAFTTRGNPTLIQKLVNGTLATMATMTYDITGQVTQIKDANNNVTIISYGDNFFLDGSPGSSPSNPPSPFTPATPTNAYPTTVTSPLIGAAHTGYYFGTGKKASSIDQNGADSYLHYLDPLDRPTHQFLPVTNGSRGWTLTSYSNSSTQIDTYTGITDAAASSGCTSCLHTRQTLDSFGRQTQNALLSDPIGPTYTTITYDSSGRTHTVSNPYRSTSDPTYGLTTYSFDVLGRPAVVTEADGNTVKLYYGADVAGSGLGGVSAQLCSPSTYGYGYPTLQIDEAGKKKQTWADAFGNTIEVDEPDSTGALSLATCYTYDTLGNLSRVDQMGGSTDSTQWVTRTFIYDELSRLKSATEPESGAITYTYDLNGNLLTRTSPAPNQTGTATVTTTYAYDALNRLTQKSYSDGTTPGVTLQYDQTSIHGVSPQNPIGRLTNAIAAGGASARTVSYDSVGRTVTEWQCTPQNCGTGSFPLNYTYDLAGDLLSASNGLGVTISYGYDTAARLSSVTSSLVDTNHPATLLSGATYNAPGALTSAAFGNGAAESFSYDSRLRLQSVSTSGFTAPTGSSGSATVSGSEQNIPGSPARAGTGSVTFSGTLQSKQVQTQTGASGAGSVTISGSERSTSGSCNERSCSIYDIGGVQVTVNGYSKTVNYGQGSTPSGIASALATAFNGDTNSPVTASSSSNILTLTSKATGSASNYSLSATSWTNDPTDFSGPSFTTSNSGSALTGGRDAAYTTVYDSGNSTITVNGHANTVSWSGSGTTTSSIASALATNINADSAASITASASGSIVTLAAKTTGASTNYSLSSSSTYDSSNFSSASFSSSNSGSTLTGGHDTIATTYDSGSVWININSTQYSASYGQGSTAASLASSLAQAISGSSSAPVTATASSAMVNLASKGTGSSTNYSLTTGSSTNQGSAFTQPSFTVAASGGTMTGGADGTATTIYSLNLGYAPNSAVASASDSVNGNWTYGYDPLSRLTCANLNNGPCATPNSGTPTYNYVYDPFGNRWQQNGPNSMILTFTGNNPSHPQNNNRMDGYPYDAAGNLLGDGNYVYTYDAENRIIQVNMPGPGGALVASYVYDASGQRVRKTTGSSSVDYLYDLSGNKIAEVSSSGVWNRGEIYGGGHLATYVNSSTYFHHTDWLGTERVRTNISGISCETITSLPFGDGQGISGSCSDASPVHFTGYERDSETGLDYASARHYGSSLGRFLSPDPLSGSPSNPQSWNRYSYVYNNPLNATDPSGMCSEEDGYSDCDWNWDASAYLWYWGPDYGFIDTTGYEGWLNYSYGDPLAAGPNLQTGGPFYFNSTTQSYANDGSIMSQIMNDPTQAANWAATFNGATSMVNIGAAWTTAGIGSAVGVVAVPAGVAYAAGVGSALLGPGGGYVLGGWPAYLRMAAAYGYGAYNIWPRVYNVFQALQVELTANQAYINTQIFLGRQAYAIEEEEGAVLPTTRTLWWELQHLAEKGKNVIYLPNPSITWPNVR